MNPEESIQEVLKLNTAFLAYVSFLNKHSITYAITGSTSLFIHGDFGRMPNDLDIYTTRADLEKLADLYTTQIKTASFPPVSWVELEDKAQSHTLAQLLCSFEDGATYDFSFSPLLKNSLRKYTVEEKTIFVVPPEEVLLLKLTAPRKNGTKDDIADVKNYVEKNTLNTEYFTARANEIDIFDIVSNYPFIKL